MWWVCVCMLHNITCQGLSSSVHYVRINHTARNHWLSSATMCSNISGKSAIKLMHGNAGQNLIEFKVLHYISALCRRTIDAHSILAQTQKWCMLAILIHWHIQVIYRSNWDFTTWIGRCLWQLKSDPPNKCTFCVHLYLNANLFKCLQSRCEEDG